MKKRNITAGLISWLIEYKPMVIGALILLLGGGGVGVALMNNETTVEVVTSTPATGEQFSIEGAQNRETANAGVVIGIQLPGYEKISLKSGTLTQDVNFPNAESNSVYVRLTLTLSDTEEMIYQSNLVEPGNTLYQIDLLRTLSRGEYPCTISYETFTMDGNFTPQNGAVMDTVLSVS